MGQSQNKKIGAGSKQGKQNGASQWSRCFVHSTFMATHLIQACEGPALSSCSSVCGLYCPCSVGPLESVVFAFWRGDGRNGPLYQCLFFLICWSCWVNCTCIEKLFWKTILFIKVIYSDKPIKASPPFSISLSLDVESTLWVTAEVIVCLKSLKYVLMLLEWIKSKSAKFTPFHGCELVLLSNLYGTLKYVIRFCLLSFSQHLSGGLIIAFDTPVARFCKDKILQCVNVLFKL